MVIIKNKVKMVGLVRFFLCLVIIDLVEVSKYIKKVKVNI